MFSTPQKIKDWLSQAKPGTVRYVYQDPKNMWKYKYVTKKK